MKVAVICRGWSLYAFNILPKDIDLYILVNEFEEELGYIGKYLKNKNICHVASRNIRTMSRMIAEDIYTKFKFLNIIQPYTRHLKDPHNLNDGTNRFFRFEMKESVPIGNFYGGEFPIPARMLGDNHDISHPDEYPSSGNAAFGYATLDTSANEIILIGMDFYDVGYMSCIHPYNVGLIGSSVGSLLSYTWGLDGPSDLIKTVARFENGEKMKESVLHLIKSHPDKKFSIYTSGKIISETENCRIINVPPPDKDYKKKLWENNKFIC